MKFTDGLWLHQPGVTAHYAAQAYEAVRDGDDLVVYATTQLIKHRGQTLGGPLHTVRLSAVQPGIIKVRIEHFSGTLDRMPKIPLQPLTAISPEIMIGESEASISSGNMTARVKLKTDEWDLRFESNGRLLTRSGWRNMGCAKHQDGKKFMFEQLALGVGECVYGFGERFTALVKNGQVVENTNKDGGTSSDQAYKSVPFYLTNRGYGVLVNETGPVSFEVASEKINRTQFSIAGDHLEYFVIDGPTPREVIEKLTTLTGRPALPPAWSFGLWLSTSFVTNYDEATVTSFIDEMKTRDLPMHVFHFDCFWMREFNWCDLEWDPRTFPDPVGMLKRLHERGLRVCVWINPYMAQRSPLFKEGLAGGFLLKKPDGSVFQDDQWQPGMGIVDFTNPAACEWYAGHLRRLLDMGVDCFKTDFGERIPTNVVWHDGADPVGMHNLYSVLYNECVFNVLEEARGKGEAVLFARSSYASGQRFPLHWGGDCWSSFESMAESLRGGLSLSLCGYGFWSHDIGGFEGNGSPEVYKRWIAFGLLSSHSRLHGNASYRIPWAYDEEACDVLRKFTKLKARLMPYLFAKAIEAHRTGCPTLRAMMLEFPNDPASDTLDRQYMLGDALLVAPVMTEDGSVSYYLPKGTWTHLLTGETAEGGIWYTTTCDFFNLPLFVRPGTILPLGACEDRPDYDYADEVLFQVYQLEEGTAATCEIPALDGTISRSLAATRTADGLKLELSGAHTGAWSVQLMGIDSAKSIEGGTLQASDGGLVIVPNQDSSTLTIQR
jgi:alpha-D-xyloside xylohydrolase